MLLARAVRVPSLLLVFCQVKQERSYAYSDNNVSQSVRRRLRILRFGEIFVFTLPSLSSVFVARYCRYGFSVTRRLVRSTLNGLFGCIFDVVRVNFFALVGFSQCTRAIPTTQYDRLSVTCTCNR